MLNSFCIAYITTALWATHNSGTKCEHLDEKYAPEDINPETVQYMDQLCKKFLKENQDLIQSEGKSAFEAGQDFWLTQHHHGIGFWDGGWPKHGDTLTERCQKYPEIYLYVGDDERIHHD